MLKTHNDAIIVNYQTFVVSTQENLPFLDLCPFGIEIRWHIDPTRKTSETFLDLLKRLDGLSFGPEGMPMDKWMFYNAAELPGFIFGFATPADDLNPWERELFGLPDGYHGPVPISMYIAVPMLEKGAWLGHNLASLNPTLPERKLGFLATLTKSIGLKAFRAEWCYGVTQWTSRALNVHTRYGPLELITAYTPGHSFAESLTYRFKVSDNCLKAAMGDVESQTRIQRPSASLFLAHDDVDGMKKLQGKLEAGERFHMVHRAHLMGSKGILPLAPIED